MTFYFQISGIHNSIDKEKHKKCSSNNSISECSTQVSDRLAHKECDDCKSDNKDDLVDNFDNISFDKEANSIVPIFSNLNLESNSQNGESSHIKKHHPSLTLELKKAYDFNPSSPSWSKR